MSKYTTEVRYIVEHFSHVDNMDTNFMSIDEMCDKAQDKIFDDYPIFDESYRKLLNRKILRHYYTREIGMETFALWKLHLNNRLNEVMPYYNQLYKSELLKFNPFYDVDLWTKRDERDDTLTNDGRHEDETYKEDSWHTQSEDEKYADVKNEKFSQTNTATHEQINQRDLTGTEDIIDHEHTTTVEEKQRDLTQEKDHTLDEETQRDYNMERQRDYNMENQRDLNEEKQMNEHDSEEYKKDVHNHYKDNGYKEGVKWHQEHTDDELNFEDTNTETHHNEERDIAEAHSGTDSTTQTTSGGHTVTDDWGKVTHTQNTHTPDTRDLRKYSDTPQGSIEGIQGMGGKGNGGQGSFYLTEVEENIHDGNTKDDTWETLDDKDVHTTDYDNEKVKTDLKHGHKIKTDNDVEYWHTDHTQRSNDRDIDVEYDETYHEDTQMVHDEWEEDKYKDDKYADRHDHNVQNEHDHRVENEHHHEVQNEHSHHAMHEHTTTTEDEHTTTTEEQDRSYTRDRDYTEDEHQTENFTEKTTSNHEKDNTDDWSRTEDTDYHAGKTTAMTNDKKRTETVNNINDYLEHVGGKRGYYTYSKMLMEFRDTFLNIDLMIINALSDLFMMIW